MISFFVPGKPIPQGSAKAFNVGGKARVFTGASNESTPLGGWRARIAHFAAQEMKKGDLQIYSGAVKVRVDFVLEAPKKFAKKPSTPAISRRCGDIDKLCRAVLDGLTGVCFDDDSQVTGLDASKGYRQPGVTCWGKSGVAINVYFLEPFK